MNLKSIRLRLPFSYAAIALLAALSLGLVLISTIRSYYQGQERRYLKSNAEQIGLAVAQLLQSDLPASVMKDQVTSWSFFMQARLQVLDQNGQPLADSGTPDVRRILTVSNPLTPGGDVLTGAAQASDGITVIGGVGLTGTLSAGGGIFIQEGSPISASSLLLSSEVITAAGISSQPAPFILPLSSTISGTMTETSGPVGFSMYLAPSLYGFNLVSAESLPRQRSHQRVELSVQDAAGNPLGKLILSDGPAYGDEIVASVVRGWLAASAVAVVLAAGVGWWISRRITAPLLMLTEVTTRMASGDLSARVNVPAAPPADRSLDEFGLLGRSFNVMAARVEEIVATLRDFIADAAHELHTPLTALRTNLELAGDEADPARRDGFYTSAQAQVARLEAMINGLLDLSRLEARRASAYEPFDLRSLAQAVGEVYASRTEQAGQQFTLTLPAEAVMVTGSQAQIRRALENLLDNALKFTPSGGSVSLRLDQSPGQARLTVDDTGIGIPAEDLPHLFERFHRGRNASAYAGSGLGLAIVKAILDAHAGEVHAENTANGAAFTLCLPTALVKAG